MVLQKRIELLTSPLPRGCFPVCVENSPPGNSRLLHVTMASPDWASIIANMAGGNLGIKAGPGVLPIIGAIWVAGLVAVGVSVWSLQSHPELAVAIALLILLALGYVTERLMRYVVDNPIPALMGGAQLLKFLERQLGAGNKSIVHDTKATEVAAGSAVAKRKPSKPIGGVDAS